MTTSSRIRSRSRRGRRYELSFRQLWELQSGHLTERTADGTRVSAFPDEESARQAYLLNADRVDTAGNRRAGHRAEAWWKWIRPDARLTRDIAKAEFDFDGDFAKALDDERLFWLAEHDLLEPWEIELLEAEAASPRPHLADEAKRKLEIVAEARAAGGPR